MKISGVGANNVKYSELNRNKFCNTLTSSPSFGFMLKTKQRKLFKRYLYLFPEVNKSLESLLLKASTENTQSGLPSDNVLKLMLKIARIEKVALRRMSELQIKKLNSKILEKLNGDFLNINAFLEEVLNNLKRVHPNAA